MITKPIPRQGAAPLVSHPTRRFTTEKLMVYGALGSLLVFSVAPLLLAWFTAFKTREQALLSPFAPPWPITFDNLREAWTVGQFDIYFKNSAIIATTNVVGMVIIASLAGYALAQMRFPGQRIIMVVLLVGLTIPVSSIIIPLYITMRNLRLLDSYGSVILSSIALASPVFIFIMRAFFKHIPTDLGDAARIDGASEVQIFLNIFLPLARPGLMTVALLEFLWSWNELLLPLVFLITDERRTLPVGMLFYQGRFTVDYGLMCAGVLILSVPITILFLVFQRDFVSGLTAGALKG
jgi:raffinose/stachyose/melibiose transport system permease protein